MKTLLRIGLLACAIGSLSHCERISQALESGKDGNSSAGDAVLVDDKTFAETVGDDSRVVVVDFYADWCGPCRRLSPELEKAVAEYDGQVVLAKVDVEKHEGLALKHGVRSIPDVRIYRGGRKQDGFVGNIAPAAIRQKLDAQVKQLGTGGGETAADGEGEAEPAIQPMAEDWIPPGVERR
jgi:thioredoxin